MRINKYLALCGVASRRKAEQLVLNGNVFVNGKEIRDLATVIQSGDKVEINEKVVAPQEFVYIMMNKPRGYVTTCSDEKNRKTVIDLLENVDERIFPVGRLDYDTEGLLLLTNDGDFAKELTHPSKKVPKTYVATLDKPIDATDLKQLETGVIIDGEKTFPAKAKIISPSVGAISNRPLNSRCIVQLTITQGRNRQVRKMFAALGYDVKHLKRTAIGGFVLGDLRVGEWRIFVPK